MLSHIPLSCRLSDDEVGGLRLIGARPGGVRLVGVGLDDLPSPHRCLARYGCFIGKRHVGGVQLRLTGAKTVLMMCIGVDVGADAGDVGCRWNQRPCQVESQRE